MKLDGLGRADLPKVLKLKQILGPSFVMLGLGLGSGELVLWPYLVSKFGLGIMWAAVVGISFQFFLNMEIERYTLVNGESVFVGLARRLKIFSPIWFIGSTIIPWMWPGIVMAGATVLGGALGVKNIGGLTIGLLVLIGLILTLGPWIYKTLESFQKWLIMLGVPIIFVLVLVLTKSYEWADLAVGIIGKGKDYWWLPAGLPLMSFLGAFAYSGAGGNMNLAQSFYIKEKGYGMGKYGGKITSILTGKKEKINLEGKTFNLSKENLKKFGQWWKLVNLEHGLVFWLTGAVTMLMLGLLSYTTVYGNNQIGEGLAFLFEEAKIIGIRTAPVLGVLFLVLAGLMLFSTQLSVFDAACRITAENLVIFDKKKFKIENLPKFYYLFLWTEIVLSIIVISLGFKEPLFLVTLGAVLNAVAMLIYSILVLWMNLTCLPKILRPAKWRVAIMFAEISFFSVFGYLVLNQVVG